MELEQWLDKHDIRKMVMRDLKIYMDGYKEEDEADYNELFENKDINNVNYEFHSVSYVINKYFITDGEARKYISAKVRLVYEDKEFAEYEAIYDLQGEFDDDYFGLI
ncbi:hypothetical protein NL50_09390 [Clostridium acetobutylicum]|nr:hypothetical protein NL50_09390 [Clostridium acetobutylicum]